MLEGLKTRRSQDFLLEGANYKSQARRQQSFSKEELFVGQRYRRMEDQKPWLVSGT